MMNPAPKRRFRLNLFDGIVIALALCVGAVLLYLQLKPAPSTEGAAPTASSLEYTIRLKRTVTGTADRIEVGDMLQDVSKNRELGTVVSVTAKTAVNTLLSETERAYVTAEIPGYEDIYIVVRTTATYNDTSVLIGSGSYELRVDDVIYVRGPGYLGSGEVYRMDRR